jgi:chemotaxis protein methyltransferase CheR
MTTTVLEPRSFDYIAKLVRDRSAIVLESSKAYLVESRLSPIARECGLETIGKLIEKLQEPNSQGLTQKVVDAMTTNETSFFRDLHPFQALKTDILPNLIKARASERVLNIWSNACSSGQEVYSIAMLIKENFPELAGWKVRLVASDLSTKILDKAKAGVFTQTEINRGLPMPLLLKYFGKQGIQWKLNDEIRSMVEFRTINLIETFPTVISQMDIVFLRNVLIYFSPETKSSILTRIRASLRSDGYLFLGGSETTMNLKVKFEKQQNGNAVYYRPC